MLNTILLIVLILLLIVMIFGAGYYLQDIKTSLSALRKRVATLEETDLPEPAIFDAKTPKEVLETKFEEDEEDSAIIQAKRPKELAKEKDRKLSEELDRYGR